VIRIMQWIDMDGPILYEAARDLDNAERWTLLKLDVSARLGPDAVAGTPLLSSATLAEVLERMRPVLEQIDPPDDD
jgi:hypothetical protein